MKSVQIAVLVAALFSPAVVKAQFTYNNNGNGTCAITGYSGSGGAVTIPSSISGLTVTSIGGATEGLNDKIRVVTRRAYGFRTYKAMEIALYHNLGKLPEPNELTHKFC